MCVNTCFKKRHGHRDRALARLLYASAWRKKKSKTNRHSTVLHPYNTDTFYYYQVTSLYQATEEKRVEKRVEKQATGVTLYCRESKKYLTYKLKIFIHFVNTVVIINIFTANLLKVIRVSGQTETPLLVLGLFFLFFFSTRVKGRGGVRERSMV